MWSSSQGGGPNYSLLGFQRYLFACRILPYIFKIIAEISAVQRNNVVDNVYIVNDKQRMFLRNATTHGDTSHRK